MTIKLEGSQIIAHEDIRALSIEERKCRFPQENENMKIFHYYSNALCQFECTLMKCLKRCDLNKDGCKNEP